MSVIGLDQTAKKHVSDVCKMGQGAECCKYLVMGTKGFECMRVNPANKKVIDSDWEVTPHVSQGDNCKGYLNEKQMKRTGIFSIESLQSTYKSTRDADKSINESLSSTESGDEPVVTENVLSAEEKMMKFYEDKEKRVSQSYQKVFYENPIPPTDYELQRRKNLLREKKYSNYGSGNY